MDIVESSATNGTATTKVTTRSVQQRLAVLDPWRVFYPVIRLLSKALVEVIPLLAPFFSACMDDESSYSSESSIPPLEPLDSGQIVRVYSDDRTIPHIVRRGTVNLSLLRELGNLSWTANHLTLELNPFAVFLNPRERLHRRVLGFYIRLSLPALEWIARRRRRIERSRSRFPLRPSRIPHHVYTKTDRHARV